jgi:DNA polymerase-3 subunit beta
MKITVSVRELTQALTWVKQAVSSRPALPVLAGVRLTVHGPRLTIAATDYDVSASDILDAAEGPVSRGETLVGHASLTRALKPMPAGGLVEITATKTAITLRGGGVEANLTPLDVTEYPQLPELPPVVGQADGEALHRSVERVARCASTDDTLPAICCVSLEPDVTQLVVAATDRYRLAVDEVPWTLAGGSVERLLIPARPLVKALHGLAKHLVSIHASDTLVGFQGGWRKVTMRRQMGEFISWRPLMRPAAQDEVSAVAEAAGLREAVVGALAAADTKSPMLTLGLADGGLEVCAVSAGQDKPLTRQLVTAAHQGGPAVTRYNIRYLDDLLRGFAGIVRLDLAGKTDDEPPRCRKTMLVSDAEGVDPFRCLLMPIGPGEGK